MLKNKKGFTLIELLVTVLIIAVLTAIAIPMYNSSVEKTRIIGNSVLVKALQDNIIVYYGQHDEYPTSFLQLSVASAESDYTIEDLTMKKKDNTCTLTFKDEVNPVALDLSCSKKGVPEYSIEFRFNDTDNRVTVGDKVFIITATDERRANVLRKVATSSRWAKIGDNSYKMN